MQWVLWGNSRKLACEDCAGRRERTFDVIEAKQRLPDRKSKVTVREVTLRANVSESTVSRIMRIMRNEELVAFLPA